MKNQYILLTGSKNNAGDYLIKYRAKELLTRLRPDRRLVDYDAWKPLSEVQLKEVNQSRALILTGGPAFQAEMYPRIYPLVEDLDRIKVPIVMMGVGWKSMAGTWQDTHNYQLTPATLRLMERIEQSGYQSSVRDYHTLNAIYCHGFQNFVMTGCPALYSWEHIGKPAVFIPDIKRVSFSLGVSFYKSRQQDEINKQLILKLRDALPKARLTVVFHHSTDEKIYRNTHNPNFKLFDAQREIIEWLSRQGIKYVDISGGAEKMMEHYSNCDLHVGYRVHAHILMASISRPTVLIAEDGRGTALKDVLGGVVFDGCLKGMSLSNMLLRRLGMEGHGLMESGHLPEDVVNQLRYEMANDYPRMLLHRDCIDRHFAIMCTFVEQLP